MREKGKQTWLDMICVSLHNIQGLWRRHVGSANKIMLSVNGSLWMRTLDVRLAMLAPTQTQFIFAYRSCLFKCDIALNCCTKSTGSRSRDRIKGRVNMLPCYLYLRWEYFGMFHDADIFSWMSWIVVWGHVQSPSQRLGFVMCCASESRATSGPLLMAAWD